MARKEAERLPVYLPPEARSMLQSIRDARLLSSLNQAVIACIRETYARDAKKALEVAERNR